MIATGAVQVTEPPRPAAVPVKVVPVTIAAVVVLPPATGVTEPIVLSIENVVAFVVVQVSVVDALASTLAGDAESVQVGAGDEGGGGGVEVTVTVAGHVTVPPRPLATPL